MTTTCDEANGRFVSGRCRLVLALVGVLLASVGLTGCLGGGGATTEDIDQLATTSDALAEDVLAGIATVAEYREASTRIGYYSCSQMYPSNRLRHVNSRALTARYDVNQGEIVNAVVDVLQEEGWKLSEGARAGREFTVLTSDIGEVTVRIETEGSIVPTIRTECLHADRDVVADYLDR